MNSGSNRNLSTQQARFAYLIENDFPNLERFWDFESRDCLVDDVDIYLRTCSRREALMLKFLAGIWLRNNRYNFDFIDAMLHLEGKHLKVIQDWANDPWWP